MNDFGEQVKALGPLGTSEGMEPDDIKSKIEELSKLVPYIKMVYRDKLASRFQTSEEYEALFTHESVESLFRDVVSYYIDPAKCQGCSMCLRRCPVDAIIGGKRTIHVIDQDKCVKCGTCFEVCPPRFSSVMKISHEPVPPPIPEEARTIVRKKKPTPPEETSQPGC
jgi:Na+-translocating ferredoxin:NAD+ oxidoreductase RNF subunit RnfB